MINKDIIVVGFALFAMFFGAGNLIFPPFLGLEAAGSWGTGFIGFVLADVGLAILAIIATAKCNGDINGVLGRAGKVLAVFLGCTIMICLGPLLAIPRTAATTFEMGVLPLFKNVSPVIFSIIFFMVVLVLTIKPSKVIDIIGQFLTPFLLITLAVLIIIGIFNPIGSTSFEPRIQNVFAEGISQGYQTMDALGAVALSAVIMTTLSSKGYKKTKEKIKLTIQASVFAAAGLVIVYGGLTFLGASITGQYSQIPLENISQTFLMVDITTLLLGQTGKIMLSIIITLACLTTAIGLTSATGEYFEKVSKGKVKYKTIVIIVCVFSAIVSNFGVSTIIKFSAPILTIIYPATVTLIVLTLFSEKIKNDNVFKIATYMALFISILTVINDFGINISFINKLPLAPYGFNWVVPVILAALIGNFISQKQSEIIYN